MKIGTQLNYGATGLCEIVDIKKEKICGIETEYYVLVPSSDRRTTIYVPTQNEKLVGKMKELLSPDEINALIMSIPEKEATWISDERTRSEEYKRILDCGTHPELIGIMKATYGHAKELATAGKKLRTSDSAFLHNAEEKLYSEIACVLNMHFDDVEPYIAERLG